MFVWRPVAGKKLTSLAGTVAFSFGAVAMVAAPAGAATTKSKVEVKLTAVSKYGKILVDQKGLALYYNKANKPPKHWACTGGCLTIWPALVLPKGQKAPMAATGVSGLGTIKGPAGMQVTWHGKPLYTFAGEKARVVSAQGAKGVWFVAQLSTPKPTSHKTTTTTGKGSYGGY
jgi:predicted lipoprotein with Yx(FWY)xxD motif